MPRGKPFKKGKDDRRAEGGKREGAGRPPEWLRERCREAGGDVIEFLISVAKGDPMEQVVTNAGETISVPAAVKDRIKAAEVVLDRGYGKTEQPIDMKLKDETERPSREELQAALVVRRGLNS